MRSLSVPVTTYVEVLAPFPGSAYGYAGDTCYAVDGENAVPVDVATAAKELLESGVVPGPVGVYLLSLLGVRAPPEETQETPS